MSAADSCRRSTSRGTSCPIPLRCGQLGHLSRMCPQGELHHRQEDQHDDGDDQDRLDHHRTPVGVVATSGPTSRLGPSPPVGRRHHLGERHPSGLDVCHERVACTSPVPRCLWNAMSIAS
ncbi:MAG: hypothetical protein IVW52_04030 [Acidimicrobiales bacterium]|nr:hypothetical protein [Acidimicrobiales bacterium]